MDSFIKEKILKDINDFDNQKNGLTPAEAEKILINILKPLLKIDGFDLYPVSAKSNVGIDFVATKQNESIGIQYKHYRNIVTADVVRALIGAAVYNQFDRVVLLTSSNFSTQAYHMASQIAPISIELIDINSLKKWTSKIEANYDDSAVFKVVKTFIEDLIALLIKNTRALDKIEWRDLERVIAELFIGIGFTVQLTPATKDGGKDVILDCVSNGTNKSFIVEIKHWRCGKKVGQKSITDFLKIVTKEKRNGGLFLSTYGYTEKVVESITEIERNAVKLGQENKIVTLCQTYFKRKSGIWQSEDDLPKLLFEDTF